MTPSQKKLLLNLGLGISVLFGLVLSMFLFIQPGDFKEYKRLTDGAGVGVQAVSEGGVASTRSGRRGSTVRYCTSWKYEIDGNKRHYQDPRDCYDNPADAKIGTSAELIYDPADLGTVFVRSDETKSSLEGSQSALRIASVIGVVLLVGSVAGLIVVNKSTRHSAKS